MLYKAQAEDYDKGKYDNPYRETKMATSDIMKAPPGQEAGPQAAGADVLPLTPHQADGDFFDPEAEGLIEPSGPLERNPVVDRELRESKECKQGKTELEIFTLQNGRHYEVVRGTAKNQRSDIGIVEGTALGTSIRGHNWHTMLQMMEEGYNVTMIGAEGGQQRWPRTPTAMKRFIGNLFSISINETAANTHEILDELDKDPDSEPGKTIKVDESRAAAVAIAFNALAPEFEREVLYSDLTGAPFPNSKPLQLRPSLVPRALQIPIQIGSLVRESPPMGPKRAWHTARTVNLNPHFMVHVAATIPTLVSGKSGELAQQVRPDAHMHFTHFTGDPWTDIPGWEQVFKNHPFVVHDFQSGDHGGIARKDTQENRLVRLRNLRDELESAAQNPEDIDWANVYLGELALAA